MRIWSLHPKYLDSKGLVALWRETLLAQHVLLGKTKGYENHPQLNRFKDCRNPVGAVACYLREIALEADQRGYCFDKSKISKKRYTKKIMVTCGQVQYEYQHLLNKLKIRDFDLYVQLQNKKRIDVHPLFEKNRGKIASWEVV